jgi:hypothetical protein
LLKIHVHLRYISCKKLGRRTTKRKGDRRKGRVVGLIDETKKEIYTSEEIIVGRLEWRMK